MQEYIEFQYLPWLRPEAVVNRRALGKAVDKPLHGKPESLGVGLPSVILITVTCMKASWVVGPRVQPRGLEAER